MKNNRDDAKRGEEKSLEAKGEFMNPLENQSNEKETTKYFSFF